MPEGPYRRLYLLVEGVDDLRFLERVVIPALSARYDYILPWQYAQQKPEKVHSFLRSIRSIGADYFFLADVDAHLCFPSKRQALLDKFTELQGSQTLIVVTEIESWYLAGVPENNDLGVQVSPNTSGVTKEQFDAARPKAFDSRIDYMIELLKVFSIETAAQRNPSFQYFARRCRLLSSG